MATTVTKAGMIPLVWKNFYDRLKTDVVTVDIKNATETITIQDWANEFGDARFDDKSNYPIGVVNSPRFEGTSLTQTKEVLEFTLEVEIYATQKETVDQVLQAIFISIDSYKPDLAGAGIREVHPEEPDYDFFERSGIRVHSGAITFRFKFYYDKGQAW